jgi:transcription elongation GreA/GreB family factor
MALHAAARRRREAAALGSDEYRAAAEEIARIEVQIARIEEPPPPA